MSSKKTAAKKKQPKPAPKRKAAKPAPAKRVVRPAPKAAPKIAAKAKAKAAPKAAAKAKADAALARTRRKAARSATSPADVVDQVLRTVGWDAERFDDEDGWTSFVTQVEDGVATVATVARVLEDSSRFVLYAILSPQADEDARAEVADFLLRANYGMPDGNFEMDLSNGEVRFKIGIDFCGLSLPSLMVRNAILDAGAAIENYGPSLARVLRGEATALEAIEAAEGA